MNETLLMENVADSLDRIASALEVLAKCVWKNPDGDHKFQVQHSDSIFMEGFK
jgi:hypothetical protein